METAEGITFRNLVRQCCEARSLGAPLRAAEVGPETWKVILKAANVYDTKPVIEGWMLGMHVRPADVPEGKLWPLESAK